ncbi:MAG: hypothetical protein KBS81_00030 [Spirochaetales bacterium]|nr:hypothetical protein [Candidatus Physcosoma equi]
MDTEEKEEKKPRIRFSEDEMGEIAQHCFRVYEEKQKKSSRVETTGGVRIETVGKKTEDWLRLQTVAQFLMALALVFLVSTLVMGCSVALPDKMEVWTYVPSSTLGEGLAFTYHPENATLDILKDEEILKNIGDGDTYAYMPCRYLVSMVRTENLVLVLNQGEELARFIRK